MKRVLLVVLYLPLVVIGAIAEETLAACEHVGEWLKKSTGGPEEASDTDQTSDQHP